MCRGPILGIARAANGLVKKGPITRAKYIFPNKVYYNQGKHVSQKNQADTRNWMIVTDRHVNNVNKQKLPQHYDVSPLRHFVIH